MYGYGIVQRLAKQGDGALGMGQSTLYPMLYNLEAKGFVASRVTEAKSGRSRRYYRLTTKGRKHLEKQQEQWQAVTKAMTSSCTGSLVLFSWETNSLMPPLYS
jgi:PadR family transcriptional regulator PadR